MSDTEKMLIKRCIKGDIDAFEKLIEAHQKRSYNIALRILKNPDDAMDISQEAFIKVFKSIKSFKFQSSFSTWLYRIVSNTCIDFLRKNKNEVYSIDNPIQTEEGSISRQFEDEGNTTEDMFNKKMTKELVHKAIEELDDQHRVIIILRDIEGFSYNEIADILSCTLGTVKSRLSRARENLKDIILRDREQNNNSTV